MSDSKQVLSQAEEMENAAAEKRQPVCVSCGHKIKRICEEQYEVITWSWNEERKTFDKRDPGWAGGGSDGARHDCDECENGCGHKDDFADNELVSY